jgi:hypothetical protein
MVGYILKSGERIKTIKPSVIVVFNLIGRSS